MPLGRTWEDQGGHVDKEVVSKGVVEGAYTEAIATVDVKCARNVLQANRSLSTLPSHARKGSRGVANGMHMQVHRDVPTPWLASSSTWHAWMTSVFEGLPRSLLRDMRLSDIPMNDASDKATQS